MAANTPITSMAIGFVFDRRDDLLEGFFDDGLGFAVLVMALY